MTGIAYDTGTSNPEFDLVKGVVARKHHARAVELKRLRRLLPLKRTNPAVYPAKENGPVPAHPKLVAGSWQPAKGTKIHSCPPILTNQLLKTLPNGPPNRYLTVVYPKIKTAVGVVTHPRFVGDGSTVSSIIRQRQQHPSRTLLTIRPCRFRHVSPPNPKGPEETTVAVWRDADPAMGSSRQTPPRNRRLTRNRPRCPTPAS